MSGSAFKRKRRERIKNHTFEFRMVPDLWKELNDPDRVLERLSWVEVPYLEPGEAEHSKGVKNLPDDCGGIYVFVIKSPILPGVSEYLAYIGRARKTASHNLRVRCHKYLYDYVNGKNERAKVSDMMHYYQNFLHLRYAKVTNNEVIDFIEAELINAIRPPFNDTVPKKKTLPPKPAFP